MAEKIFLVDLNLNGNIIKNVRLESLAEAPANPSAGAMYINSTDGKLYYYNGTAWVAGAEYTASNKSSAQGTVPVYDGNDGNDFQFRVLQGSGNLSITQANGIITISIDESALAVSDATEQAIEDAKAEVIGDPTDDATADTVNGAKAYADAAVAALDATAEVSSGDPDAPATPVIEGIKVLTGITETDGSISRKSEAAADKYGSAQKALNDAKAYTDAEIAKLDSSVSAGELGSAGSAIEGVQVLTGVTEADGKLSAKTDVAVDKYGSAQKALNDAKAYTDAEIGKLDVSDTEVTNQFVTEVSETNGKIAVKRARPTASNISVSALDHVAAGDLQTVLGALEDAIETGGSEAVVTVEKQQSAESGYAATYVVKQGGSQVGVKINIPKDYLVKSASVETVTTPDVPYSGAQVGDKYIDFVVNTVDASETAQHIYLPVNDLVDVYTAGDGLALSNTNEFSIDIDANSEAFLSIDGTSKKLKLSGVQNAIDSAVNALDSSVAASADPAAPQTPAIAGGYAITGVTETNGKLTAKTEVAFDKWGSAQKALNDAKDYADSKITGLSEVTKSASGTAAHSGTFVVSSVTTEHGSVKSVGSVEVEAAGAAAAAKSEVIGQASDTKDSDTIKGAKKYADNVKNTIDAYEVNGVDIKDSPVISANVAQGKLLAQDSGVQVTTPVPGSIKAFYNGAEVTVAVAYNGTKATLTWNGSLKLDIYYLATAVSVSAAAAE